MTRGKLEKLASERTNPCVTISMKTHRTHPDNTEDAIVMRNLLKEAETRVTKEFSKEHVGNLLKNLMSLESEIDFNYNLDSLHIFLSEKTKEIVKSPWQTQYNFVQVADKFAVKPLIKIFNRTEEYLILLLSQSGANLFQASNDSISEEIKNDDFPFTDGADHLPGQRSSKDKLIDGRDEINLLRQYLNKIDKAVVRVHNKTGMKCIVISTADNYSHLMKVADKPSVYMGHVTINYKDTANHTIAAAAWEVVESLQNQSRADAIKEMLEAQGVITGLPEIFKAAKEGRGELLISNDDYTQPVKITGEFTFELASDVTHPDITDDIVSEIAWDVISKKGRAIFTTQEELKPLGDIALKVRY